MNLFKSIIRNLIKFKYYSLINLFGLILGFACSITLFLYVGFEFSFDQFHADKDRIFRVSEISTSPKEKEVSPLVRVPVGPDMKAVFPEIEDFARLKLSRQGRLLKFGEKSISISKSLYADANFFQFFSFKLQMGEPGSVLTDLKSIVLTESVSHRLFGNEDPVGNTIICNNKSYVVSGIATDPPLNSHIPFDVVFPIASQIKAPGTFISWNGGMSATTFIKLHQANQLVEVKRKLPDFLWEKVNKANEGSSFFTEFEMEPIARIHLHSNVDWDPFPNKSYTNVISLLGIGLLVLLIAIINYLFISSGTLALRSKEFGVKKYLGIGKYGILRQFLVESLLMFFSAGIIATFILVLSQQGIEKLFGDVFMVSQLHKSLWELILIVLLISIVSGLILYIGFRRVLRGQPQTNLYSSPFRKRKIAYVSAFQFCISIGLIASILVVYKQLNFALRKDLGFKAENIINVMNGEIGEKGETLIAEFQKLPGVMNASASFGIPGLEATQNGYKPEGTDQWEMYNALHVDDHFFDTYHVKLLDGRNFRAGKDFDTKSFIINETLAKQLGWQNPVGKTIFRGENHEVVGVVKDFHISSIYEKIPPLIISKEFQSNFYTLSIALRPDNISQTLKQLEKIWEKVIPNTPFNYFFLDKRINSMYGNVQQTINILMLFTGISILISTLGLFGITLLLLNSRTKEIGIRKVNGAKISEILAMLNKDFVKWVVIAFVIATPIAWYVMNKWLENFAYKTTLSWWIFALAGLLALGIALLTVSWQSWKAATRNPVEALRYE
ncbi:ABC transporter permease [Saccharicrinis sp. FJH62]|uniref:ABC transporter permease n=1 Tax=Saccharicrinis sp. FJH62 TaxID=3344657 RepID=UPI0035D4218E